MPDSDVPSHFKGKDALDHVVEAQVQGIMSSTEVHGEEMPGHLSAGTDAARETALLMLLVWLILYLIPLNTTQILLILAIFALSLAVWKAGRSAWLGWSRLERLHRVLKQEKWEIEHNRAQERSELADLYAAKGFEGQLLEDVLDVLMADGDRLLRVMVEEELGLSLEKTEHPLKQAYGAFLGVCLSAVLCLFFTFFFPNYGLVCCSFLIGAIAAAFSAHQIGNQLIPAVVWTVGLFALSAGTLFFLMQYVLG